MTKHDRIGIQKNNCQTDWGALKQSANGIAVIAVVVQMIEGQFALVPFPHNLSIQLNNNMAPFLSNIYCHVAHASHLFQRRRNSPTCCETTSAETGVEYGSLIGLARGAFRELCDEVHCLQQNHLNLSSSFFSFTSFSMMIFVMGHTSVSTPIFFSMCCISTSVSSVSMSLRT